jgi:hypothetical protein
MPIVMDSPNTKTRLNDPNIVRWNNLELPPLDDSHLGADFYRFGGGTFACTLESIEDHASCFWMIIAPEFGPREVCQIEKKKW